MRGIRISSRYAKSLLNLCIERGETDQVYEDMKLVYRAVTGTRDLRVFLESPVIKSDKKNAALEKVFGGSVSRTTMGFMSLLTHKGRESMLQEIAESFIAQVKTHKNITSAKVVSAVSLDEKSRAAITGKVQELAPGTIELEEKVDPELIGGFVLQVGDFQIDTSILTNFRNLRRDFSENPYIPEL
jgi:F-type H+-transporting ATPase subunit delta